MEQGGRYNESQNELTFIPGLELEPIKGWMIYVNYRWKMNFAPVTNHNAKVYGSLTDGSKIAMRTVNSFESYRYDSFYNSPNIYSNYTKKIGNHTFTIMMGFEQELIKYGSTYGKRYDLVSDDVPSLTTATGRQEVTGEGAATSSIGQWATRSLFGRMNYNFKEKYLLEFSFRRDGSSKFPDGYRWGMFPSGSAAYVISRESFWKPLSQFIPMMKLRASYGSLGNQDVANYLYIERLPINSKLPYIMGDNLPVYIGMPGLISPGLTWEKVNTSNIGLDAGFMKSRLNLSFDYFIRNTFDMLGPSESLPAVLGTKVPKRNNATLKSQGFEFVVDWKDLIGEISYNIKFMISDVTSKVTDYYNPSRLLVKDGYYKGAKIGDIWGFTTTGLFKSDEAAQTADQSYLSAEPWRAGDVEYTDINNDGKIDIGKNTVDNPGDLSVIGNSTPRYSYSFLTGGTWKSFDFNMLWQGVAKRDLALDGSLFWGATGGQWFSTCLREHQDYWTPENPDAYWPRPYLNKGNKNHYPQTRYLQNGAYLRLKSVQIGYTLPSKLTKKVFIQNLRIYVSGENLLTFTKLMKTFDPEATGGATGSGQMYPLQKLVSTGISITF
jgi:TonB-linked SusC/RagA family outer membrane protein